MGTTSGENPAGGRPLEERPLDGLRVLVTRSPERSGPLTEALRLAGAIPLLLPLTAAERAPDQVALDDAFEALGAGSFEWLVVSSATTVLALQEKAAERAVRLGDWLPAGTRVAAVGPASRTALEAAGIAVHFEPEQEHSAAGIVNGWPGGPAAVLLPQADIAAPALARGLASKGARVRTVVAYSTVDFPAEPARRLGQSGSEGTAPLPLLTPAEAKAEVDDGALAAVVAASPSAVRRIGATLVPLGSCRLVAIGPATAAEAEALGLVVAATAREATPEGLVAAVIRAVAPNNHSSTAGPQ
ncbi:uroporphyrinogen-III synthase [Arthrobacter sp. ISL-65]|uniref:uroporphyrinogen-III synthase n=1 Tax=Arthrobacter sp. ISL-65 TaxID=2819112 RepID=UPI001BEC669E|nr:uroporphyrinogen-III synthase [Arthrobacter sp. ISL-65]MBT2549903.1 uroporphyrinogen-III synthase [Arthrobacter sp. ISL-65]